MAACAPGPKPNQVMGRLPQHSWHGPIGRASYSNGGVITVELGGHTELTTTTCFKHAKAKIGIMQDDARVQVEAGGTEVIATDGRLEIDDCTPGHLKATMWASFADGGRVEASIDSNMTATSDP
ncbi:MAG: hypothetical protein ABI591_28925 [Kofleriaceae bacterium]